MFNRSNESNGKKFEGRKSYGDRDRKSYGDRDRKSYGDRDRKSYGDRDKKPYGDRDKKLYGDRDKKSYGDRDKKPYGDRDKKSYGDRDKKPYGDRDKKPYGDRNRKPYGDRDKKPYGDKDRKPYGDRDKKPYGDRDRKPYGDRDKKPYGDRDRKPYGDRDRKPYGDRDKKPYGDRDKKPYGKEKRNFRGNSRQRQTTEDEFEIGTFQELVILRYTDFGAYLGYEKSQSELEEKSERNKKNDASILLPGKYLNDENKVGDKITVFIYKDSDDRPVATTEKPLISNNKVAPLTVKEVSAIGAFMDWGLDKDLLLPFREMEGRVAEGETVLVRMYVDKSGRPACTMRDIWKYLSQNAPYKAGDIVTGRVFELGYDFGTFIAVDDKYAGMIPKHEKNDSLKIGDILTLHVTGVKEDGKLDLSLRQEAYKEIDNDSECILKLLESYAGVLPFSEKASSEVIHRETGLSKNAFKRAIGHLYKERKIEIKDGIIHLLSE
jgi:predicted RNA-binding protein (virulence factor B family)